MSHSNNPSSSWPLPSNSQLQLQLLSFLFFMFISLIRNSYSFNLFSASTWHETTYLQSLNPNMLTQHKQDKKKINKLIWHNVLIKHIKLRSNSLNLMFKLDINPTRLGVCSSPICRLWKNTSTHNLNRKAKHRTTSKSCSILPISLHYWFESSSILFL